MTQGEWLQVVGATCEVAGLCTVAWGISNTRRSFAPDRPSVGQQLSAPFKKLAAKLVARFRRRRPVIITASAGGVTWSGGSVKATVKMGSWDGLTDDERFKRIRDMIERHEEMLDRLDTQLETERNDRKKGDEQEGRSREATRQLLEGRISEAAAGGLRLEAWGVLLFAFGIVFGLWGNLIA
jgi:hypothetical protein